MDCIKGSQISVPVWGGQKSALLAPWSEIRKLGFKKRDRSFGTLNDGSQALFFYAQKHCCSLSDEQLASCRYEWYVTTETLDQITD